ncbi:unnamed protein product [Prunus brigantina]
MYRSPIFGNFRSGIRFQSNLQPYNEQTADVGCSQCTGGEWGPLHIGHEGPNERNGR